MLRLTCLVLLATALAGTASASAASRLGARPLERGDRGTDVRQLQKGLRIVGVTRISADGIFGRKTRAAVVRYERRQRLAVDGRVSPGQARGLARRAKLPSAPRADAAPAAPPIAVPPPTPGAVRFPVFGPVTWGDGFGQRGGRHQGIDLLASCGTPLLAPVDGTVRIATSQGAAGRYLILTRANGEEIALMHLRDVAVATGQPVAAGQQVGTVGETGNATACHLHIEHWLAPGWQAGKPVDPEPWLRAVAPAT